MKTLYTARKSPLQEVVAFSFYVDNTYQKHFLLDTVHPRGYLDSITVPAFFGLFLREAGAGEPILWRKP